LDLLNFAVEGYKWMASFYHAVRNTYA